MTGSGVKSWPKMTSREEFRFLADLVLTRSSGDQTMVKLHDLHSGTTRFANNQVVQNVDTRRGTLAVTVADRKSTRLNSSHIPLSRMPSSA